MSTLKLFPGDIAAIGDVEFTADHIVTLASTAEITRKPKRGLTDLPETKLRISDLWRRGGRRVPVVVRQDLRCPCGSVYIRRSATHHSCQCCQRVWGNDDVEAVGA
jgi:hypothetical protein